MSALTREEIQRIAKLARLELSEEEIELYRTRLARVLDHVRELEKADTGAGGFVRHVPRDAVAFREDRSIEFESRDELMANAPAARDGYFLVPPVLEQS